MRGFFYCGGGVSTPNTQVDQGSTIVSVNYISEQYWLERK